MKMNILYSLFADLETEQAEVDDDYWFSLLGGETETRDLSNVEDTGAYQHLLIRLSDERYLKRAEQDFTRFFAENNIAAQVRGWRQGGPGGRWPKCLTA